MRTTCVPVARESANDFGQGEWAWEVQRTKFIGGSRRDLHLEYKADGARIAPSNASFWAFDNVIRYVPPHTPSFAQVDALLLIGHDGFRMFAILIIPIFYLNAVGRADRGRSGAAGLVGTLLGM